MEGVSLCPKKLRYCPPSTPRHPRTSSTRKLSPAWKLDRRWGLSRSADWCYDYLEVDNMAKHFLFLFIFQYEDYVHLDDHALAKHREPIGDCAALAVVPAIEIEYWVFDLFLSLEIMHPLLVMFFSQPIIDVKNWSWIELQLDSSLVAWTHLEDGYNAWIFRVSFLLVQLLIIILLDCLYFTRPWNWK